MEVAGGGFLPFGRYDDAEQVSKLAYNRRIIVLKRILS